MSEVSSLSPTKRSSPTRTKDRVSLDRQDLYDILDAGFIGHLGLILNGDVHVVPTGYGRHEETLYIHGSTGAQSIRQIKAGVPVCFTVTHLDGIIYARSVFNHSMNYRCAVIHGNARYVTDPEERDFGLTVLTEHLAPGSWYDARLPNKREEAQTAVLALPLAEASVKIRSGYPSYQDQDLDGPHWAGILPIVTTFGTPDPCPLLPEGLPIPERVTSRVHPTVPPHRGDPHPPHSIVD